MYAALADARPAQVDTDDRREGADRRDDDGLARIATAKRRTDDAQRERVLQSYPKVMADALGGYYTLGRYFAKMIGNPTFMKQATKYGLPRTALIRASAAWSPPSPMLMTARSFR